MKAPLLPIETFFQPPVISDVKISPSGDYIAWLAPLHNRLNIAVCARNSKEHTFLTNVTDRDIAGYTWKDNSILYMKDNGGDENYHLYSVSLQGEQQDLTPFEGVRVDIVDTLPHKPSVVLIQMNKEQAELFDIYEMNIETGEHTLIQKNPGGIIGWATDLDGHIRVGIRSDGVDTEVLYRKPDQEGFVSLMTTSFKEQFAPVFFDTGNSEHIICVSNVGRNTLALVKYNTATKTEEKVLFEVDDVDISEPYISRKSRTLYAIDYERGLPETVFFDTTYEQQWKTAQELIGYEHCYIVSSDRNEEQHIVVAQGDTKPATYYLYNSIQKTVELLGCSMPWVQEEFAAPMRSITYTARDGMQIQAYLTLPVGVEHTNLPLILHPHGGPWVRDSWRYNRDVQFLANRGYAVLQPNYRGSTGFGKKFFEASFKQWGRAMQDDLTDAVQWAVEQGIADAKRVAIYGGSYGGYATLAGLVFTPEVYACGIDVVGVSNLFTFLQSIPPYWKPLLDKTYEMVGHPEHDADLLRAASPVFHAHNIKVPLFVIQGRNDPRVNINESDQIVEALRQQNIPVEYLVRDDEGHGFRNVENKVEMYSLIERFLAQHI